MRVRAIEGNMIFVCPGCDQEHVVRVEELPGSGRDVWEYNGNAAAPTFTPSYLLTTHMWEPPVTPKNLDAWRAAPWPQTKVAKVCHSFITDGRIQYLGDCTHHLAGQTIDLPEAYK